MSSLKNSFSFTSVFAEALGLDASDIIAVGILSLTALVGGAIVIALTVDIPGDGPAHAAQAYLWSQHPKIVTFGGWLPGFNYWAGLWMMLIPNPLFVPRLYNLGVTTLTIPVFYALVRKLYGSQEALLATIALVALPLRIGLGASSLTEISSLFLILSALLCLMLAVEENHARGIPLMAAIGLLVGAEMTRYEVWTYVPWFIGYLYARTRNIAMAAGVMLILALFPIAWSVGNYLHSGNPFPGFYILSHAPEGAVPVNLETALGHLYRLFRREFGWLLTIGAIAGLISELYMAVRSRVDANRAWYAIFAAMVWASIFRGALLMGPGLYARYLLLGFTLALPLAAVAYVGVAGRFRYPMAIGVVAIAASLAIPYRGLSRLRRVSTPIFVTRVKPTDMIAIARWLQNSPYKNDAVVMTRLDWNSSYLPLYDPQVDNKSIVVSVWFPEEFTREFVERQHPALLITQRADSAEIARLDHVLGRAVEPMMHDPVFRSGQMEVYDITNLTAHH